MTNTPQQSQETSPKTSTDAIAPPSTQPLSRDEQADKDLQDLISEFQSDSQHSSRPIQSPLRFLLGSESTSSTATSQTSRTQQASNDGTDDHADIASANLPTTLSCRDCFDYAFFCQSFGGQFVNVYRYGELRDCKQHWSDFWFCMRTKSYGEDERKKAIQDRWRNKEHKFKTGPSSEDVWRQRNERVTGAFTGNWEDIFRAEKEAEESIEKGISSTTVRDPERSNGLGVEKLDAVVGSK
ncbi:MAG: hypothetical protein Q9160_005538 [Pyrenula sp. 1 TL-2023]